MYGACLAYIPAGDRPAGRCFAPGHNRCAAPHLYWKRQQPSKQSYDVYHLASTKQLLCCTLREVKRGRARQLCLAEIVHAFPPVVTLPQGVHIDDGSWWHSRFPFVLMLYTYNPASPCGVCQAAQTACR
jgi:hypothetical protein